MRKNGRCKCNGHGDLSLTGECHCDKTWGGDKCEVDCKNLPFGNAIYGLKCNDEGRITECETTGVIPFSYSGQADGTITKKKTYLELQDGHCAPVCTERQDLVMVNKVVLCLMKCNAYQARNPTTGLCELRATMLREETSTTSLAKTAASIMGRPTAEQCEALDQVGKKGTAAIQLQ